MQIQRLTEDELKIVDNPEDIPYLEIIKGMSLDEMESFKCYRPKNLDHYNRKQNEWLSRELDLIIHRPGHPENLSHDELQRELTEDMIAHHNGQRFKIFYFLKYPGLVERIDQPALKKVELAAN